MSATMAAEGSRAPRGDESDEPVPHALSPSVVRSLSEISTARVAAQIAFEWGSIALAGTLCWRFMGSHPWLYPLAVMFIGARQHGLLVLAHDAAHYRLAKNRAVNDWLGEVLLAWPFLVLSMRAYRANHFPHHRHLNTDRDPDWMRKQNEEWRFPKTPLALVRLLLSYASGLGFLRFLVTAVRMRKPERQARSREDRRFARGRLAFVAALFATLFVLDAWVPFLCLWLVPYATWMQLCFHIRSIAEHFAIHGRAGTYAQTRTVAAPWFEELLLVPNHVGYHLEHHLYPSVPFHRLPELHRQLMSNPEHARSAAIAHSYLDVLRDCTAPRRAADVA